VVGVGASAGGLEAFQALFSRMPANSGMVFVLVQHLDPETPGSRPTTSSWCRPTPRSRSTTAC
jgi:hypothetical protein